MDTGGKAPIESWLLCLLALLDKLLHFSSRRFFFSNRGMRSLPQRITVKTKHDNGAERHVNCTHRVKFGPIPVCSDPGFT